MSTKAKFIYDQDEEIEKIVSEYSKCRPLFDDYGIAVQDLLSRILRRNSFKYIIEKRSKDPEKLRKKLFNSMGAKTLLERIIDKDDEGFDSWKSIQDLAGVRVIFNVKSELDRFVRIVSDELGEAVKINTVSRNNYTSTHIIFSPDKSRQGLSEYQDFLGLSCEIQLRTVLDHAWAETSHTISYKPDEEFSTHTAEKTKSVIKQRLDDIKTKYIEKAELELNGLFRFYKKVEAGAEVLDSTNLNNLSTLESNQDIYLGVSFLYDSLSSYRYELPPDTDIYQLISNIFAKAKSNKVTVKTDSFGFRSKTVVDISIKLLDVLDAVKYMDVAKTIESLKQFMELQNPRVDERIKKVLKDTAKYEYDLIKEYGILIQVMLMDLLENGGLEIDYELIIATELLDPSFEGNEMKDEKTFSWMFGSLPVIPESINLRRRVIEYLFSKFDSDGLENKRESIVTTLGNACRLPDQGKFGDDFIEMVAADIKLLVENYHRRLFGTDGKLVVGLTIAKEVISQLYIRNDKLRAKVPEAQQLVEKIKKDDQFKIFQLLAVGKFEYSGEEDYQKAEDHRGKEVDVFFKSITAENYNVVGEALNNIAVYYTDKERWQWQEFSDLACRIAMKKPDVAEKMLVSALKDSKPLAIHFASDFLLGFRKTDNYSVWQSIVNKIIGKSSPNLLKAIFFSYWGVNEEHFDEYVRDEDVALLEQAVNGKGRFTKFKLNSNEDRTLHHALFNALLCVYKKDPKRVEEIIAVEMRNHPGLVGLFVSMIDIGLVRSEISFESWDNKSIEPVITYMVETDSIDHNSNRILSELSTKSIMDLFSKRIEKRIKMSGKKSHDDYSYLQYDSIPSYLDPKLVKKMQDDPEFKTILESWVEKMDARKRSITSYIYGMQVAEFVQKFGGPPFAEIRDKLIASGTDFDLKKVVDLMGGVSYPDLDLCFEIAKKTDNTDILNKIESRIFGTGVVSGEYGIYYAYKQKVEQIKKIQAQNAGNARIKKFGDKVIKDIQQHMEGEKQRVEESKILRKIEFEG